MTWRKGTPVGTSHDEALVGNVVTKLKSIDRSAGWARTAAVGEAVIDTFFDGDCGKFKASPRLAHQSLRYIASHSGCPLKKSALASAVHVYSFSIEHPEVRELEHVFPGHVAAVLRYKTDEQLALLKAVQVERLSVKALSEKLATQGRTPTKVLALPPSRVTTMMHAIERELDCLTELLSRPSSWLNPRVERAHAAVERFEESVAKALSAVYSIQASISKRHALDV